jgi:putative ABC transport system ATP-binding protein
MGKESIRVENLTKKFTKGTEVVRIVEDTSFSIDKGELVALVAPSGAGKTTLLMMIGCVEEPTSGKIYLGDEKVYDNRWLTKQTRKIRREKIGFIFQAHYLIPFLTVLENITLLPQTNGVSKEESEKFALELLEYFDIKDKADVLPSTLSGGQNQRVAIARALANKPQIILADEPTAALDSQRSVAVVEMLKKIALEQDVAIVMVTHDEAMLPLCDRTLKIENKKVISIPSTQHL